MELWWIGQSGFRLRGAGTGAGKGLTLFVDPYLSPHKGRTWEPPIGPDALAHADAVLCTHEHIDHFDQPAIKAANEVQGAAFKVIVPEPIVDQVLALGVPRERVIGAQPGQDILIAGAHVHPVPAKHGVTMKDAYSFGKELSHGLVRFLGYVVDIAGVRAYHACDTIPYEGQIDTLKALRPHLALLPINGRDFFRETDEDLVGNMEPGEAVHVAHAIGAQALVPMHWELFPFNRGFPRDVAFHIAQYAPELTLLMFGRAAKMT